MNILVVFLFYCAVSYAFPSSSLDSTIPSDGRIIGGQDADISQFPYQVSLRNGSRHFCGGSIYRSNIILTAAHCFVGYEFSELSVVAGTSSSKQVGISFEVREIVTHPDFDGGSYDNDVAILLLAHELTFGPTIQPIALAVANSKVIDGSRAYVSGWGYVSEMGPISEQLQYVAVMTINWRKCVEAYKPAKYDVTDGMICAGEERNGMDACDGDSGGPLVLQGRLIGIVSWGEGCARSMYPGVYANVAFYRHWIDYNVNRLL